MLCHVDDKNDEFFNKFLARRVEQCYVEFLRPGSQKPHVVFKLNIDRKVSKGNDSYMSCRLSMDCERTDLIGYFYIRLLPFAESSKLAAVSLQFRVLGNHTVGEWIQALRGQHRSCTGQNQGDLTIYSFEVAASVSGPEKQLAGCRDFMTQAMIRLSSLGFVNWYFHGEAVDNIRLINYSLFVRGDGFHDLIGNNFQPVEEMRQHEKTVLDQLAVSRGYGSGSSTREIKQIYVSELKVSRGRFWDVNCWRIESFGEHALPYKPMSAREQMDLQQQHQLLHNPQFALQLQQRQEEAGRVQSISMGYTGEAASSVSGKSDVKSSTSSSGKHKKSASGKHVKSKSGAYDASGSGKPGGSGSGTEGAPAYVDYGESSQGGYDYEGYGYQQEYENPESSGSYGENGGRVVAAMEALASKAIPGPSAEDW
ncbi:hypothetical protein SPI_00214 [Niveomyces insectorum RCEF 264]|uniref:Uncharacterized protein n=1 Tax=Niveomyces insectorum RCEF 264 TaxID=1081102 RepID=A0A167ZXR4_9HYPO|nr:hypothetical protein SPI_00214 [Niveomyces insectorum RCEF 264]